MRQQILTDLRSKRRSVKTYSPLVNLRFEKQLVIRIKPIVSVISIFVLMISFVFNSVFAPIDSGVKAAQSASVQEERRMLEAQLAELEQQIDDYEDKISEYKKQGKSLQSEIKKLNDKVAQINLQIKAITLNLQKLDKEISVTQNKIVTTQDKIEAKKKTISELLQMMYEKEQQGMMLVLLSENNFSDMVNELNHFMSVQDTMQVHLEEITGLHNQLLDEKESLALEKLDVESLRHYQDLQKKLVEKTKTQKDELLKATKGKESEYQKMLKQTQKTVAEIRSRIFQLIGGGQLSFGDAYKFAQVAEKATGVRAALILAVLDRESALGKNVGQCSYKEAMHPTRDVPSFLAITKELGINPETVKVSCAITSDGAYGGAMGPAQFIPSTWMSHRDEIASLTGHNPPNPWNHTDAFMATAVYLKRAGAAKATLAQEKAAAAKYYAGSRWQRYLSTYGARVVNRAEEFQKDIEALNS